MFVVPLPSRPLPPSLIQPPSRTCSCFLRGGHVLCFASQSTWREACRVFRKNGARSPGVPRWVCRRECGGGGSVLVFQRKLRYATNLTG